MTSMGRAKLSRLAPGKIDLLLFALSGHRLCKFDHSLGRVRSAIEDHVLHPLEQICGDIFVDAELARVHDGHIQARFDRVVEECGVHRLSHEIVSAKREREVADAAADPGPRADLLDDARCFDEVLAVGVVLLDPGGDCEDVRIEDDLLGPETSGLGE